MLLPTRTDKTTRTKTPRKRSLLPVLPLKQYHQNSAFFASLFKRVSSFSSLFLILLLCRTLLIFKAAKESPFVVWKKWEVSSSFTKENKERKKNSSFLIFAKQQQQEQQEQEQQQQQHHATEEEDDKDDEGTNTTSSTTTTGRNEETQNAIEDASSS